METHHHTAVTPTAILRGEHEVILRALALLERLGGDLEAGKPVDREALRWVIQFFRTFADRCHHAKEEQHLFPALERRGVPRQRGPLGVMLEEHEGGRALVRAMAEGTDRAIAEAARRYVVLLRAHIDKENTVLFPLADQLLAAEEQRELAQAFEAVEQAVAGPGAHEGVLSRLAELDREIIRPGCGRSVVEGRPLGPPRPPPPRPAPSAGPCRA